MCYKEIKLGDALKKIVGGGTPSKKNKLYWGGKIPWASVKDMPLENHSDKRPNLYTFLNR